MRPDGSQQQRLTVDDGEDFAPRWSPDGQWIVFSSERNSTNSPPLKYIYRMRPDGSSVEQLTNLFGFSSYPAWSPDGERIAFVSNFSGNNQIYTIRADGTDLWQLSNSVFSSEYPTWSPDGQWIAFTQFGSGRIEVYRMRVDGSQVAQLTNHPALDMSPDSSPFIDDDWNPALLLVLGTTTLILFHWKLFSRPHNINSPHDGSAIVSNKIKLPMLREVS
jgi:TolB protein